MKLSFLIACLSAVFVLAGVVGCDTGGEPAVTEPAEQQVEPGVVEEVPAETETEEYAIRGEVVAIDRDKPAVTLDHEEIEGFMTAMTMEFQVEDTALLEGLAEGDRVEGQLVKNEEGIVITQLETATE